MKYNNVTIFLALLFGSSSIALSFQPPCFPSVGVNARKLATGRQNAVSSSSNPVESDNDDNDNEITSSIHSRRQLLLKAGSSMTMMSMMMMNQPEPALALVKGVAPPSGGYGKGDKPKCTNIEECEAMREKREQQLREEMEANAVPTQKTSGGVAYKDEQEGSGSVTVQDNDEVTLYYKVLKLGKRSYDGLSGEGTVVFSRGYGLEDDERKPGDKSFITTVGGFNNVKALNEALIGMKAGGIRRISVLPQKGWRKPTAACDGGPGGSGTGGDLKTDYVVVPTATMVEQEACFDMSRQPFPSSYAQQRRMAQRFDQSLIMEVEVVAINRP